MEIDRYQTPRQTDPGAPKNDWTALVRRVQERPQPYIGAVVFVLVVLAATGIYRVVQASTMRATSTEYAAALEIENPADRSAALGAVADSGSRFAARALYLEGEAALDGGDYDTARETFQALRERYPNFEFVPDAVEGLGFIEEDTADFASARRMYEEVAAKWPESIAALRQPYNVARTYEGEENLASAIDQYRRQLETFPGSTIAMRAQQRLNELRESNPDLFADDVVIDPAAPVLQELTTEPVTEPLSGQLELSIDQPAAPADTIWDDSATDPSEETPKTPTEPESPQD